MFGGRGTRGDWQGRRGRQGRSWDPGLGRRRCHALPGQREESGSPPGSGGGAEPRQPQAPGAPESPSEGGDRPPGRGGLQAAPGAQTQRPRPLGTRRRHLTRESASWPPRTFAGLRDHPLLGLTLHPLTFTSQIKPPKGDPGGQCVPAAPQAPCPPSAGESDLGRAVAGRWARRVWPGRPWSSKQEAPESGFSLVSSGRPSLNSAGA